MKRLKVSGLALLFGLSWVYPVYCAPVVNPYSSSSQQIMPVKPLTVKGKLKLDKDPNVTFTLKAQKLGAFLHGLAKMADLNLIIDTSVKTDDVIPELHLENMPLSEVLALILNMKGLVAKRINTTLIITTEADLAKLGLIEESETVVRTFPIVNATADEISKQLTDILPLMNAIPKKVMVDTRLSALVIIGSPDVIDVISKIIPTLDKPLPQVMVEIKIIGLSSSGSKQLGFAYGLAEKKVGVGLLGAANVPGGDTTGIPGVSGGSSAITFNPLGEFTAHFNARMDALLINGEAKILSNPRVATQYNKEATINVTDQIPVVTTTTTATASTQSISWAPIGEQLSITPTSIDVENGFVTMILKPTISNKGKEVTVSGNPAYETQNRSVTTTMRVKDGESIVIGGLKRKTTSSSQSKVPLLGDIPLIGALFTNNSESEDDVEVIIIVTPHITVETATTIKP